MMRINARLENESEANFNLLRKMTGLSTTEIIRHSLALYVKEISGNRKALNQSLLKELVGIGSGPNDLSENYKNDLTEAWDAKFDHRG